MDRRKFLLSIAAAALAGKTAAVTAELAKTPDIMSSPLHRIMTCNILLDLSEHKGTLLHWDAVRRGLFRDVVKSRKPDIVCMQEVGAGQMRDIEKDFPGFTSFGYPDPYVDKKPRRFQACKNAIIYKSDRYELVSANTYWLSNRPAIAGSILPGTKLPRHVTWLRLKDRQSGAEFRVLDTHFALEQPVRLKEAEIIAGETSQYADNFPQFLCGDLNSLEDSPEQQLLKNVGWKDTYRAVHGNTDRAALPADAPKGTHFRRGIDFVYYRGNVKPVAAEVIRDHEGESYPSDHYFVMADVEIPAPA